ncbi:MAG TPA: DUF4440 domain-containing protein [Polyangiaceae bacterium]|nr:DUF4440 domain-containing protein [Polyangiaceae bacterium]
MAESRDKHCIDALVTAFFGAFSVEHARRDGLAELRELFIPEAVIVKGGGAAPEVWSLAQFIEPRARLLAGGSLVAFVERELSERTEIFGSIALRSSTYTKSGVLDGTAFEGRGVKLMQLVKTPASWRVSALSWEDEPSS